MQERHLLSLLGVQCPTD